MLPITDLIYNDYSGPACQSEVCRRSGFQGNLARFEVARSRVRGQGGGYSLVFREGPAVANSARNKMWYLAQIKPNCAQVARRNLARQGFETFLPVETVTQVRGGRHVTTDAPLFPGYLFVLVAPDSSPWRTINSTLGIARLVSFGTFPAPVPQPIIDGLRQRCDPNGRLVELAPLNPGDRVRVAHGPLASFLAQVDRIEPNKRVWLLMDIMGGKTHVAVPQADLRLAS